MKQQKGRATLFLPQMSCASLMGLCQCVWETLQLQSADLTPHSSCTEKGVHSSIRPRNEKERRERESKFQQHRGRHASSAGSARAEIMISGGSRLSNVRRRNGRRGGLHQKHALPCNVCVRRQQPAAACVSCAQERDGFGVRGGRFEASKVLEHCCTKQSPIHALLPVYIHRTHTAVCQACLYSLSSHTPPCQSCACSPLSSRSSSLSHSFCSLFSSSSFVVVVPVFISFCPTSSSRRHPDFRVDGDGVTADQRSASSENCISDKRKRSSSGGRCSRRRTV